MQLQDGLVPKGSGLKGGPESEPWWREEGAPAMEGARRDPARVFWSSVPEETVHVCSATGVPGKCLDVRPTASRELIILSRAKISREQGKAWIFQVALDTAADASWIAAAGKSSGHDPALLLAPVTGAHRSAVTGGEWHRSVLRGEPGMGPY